MQIAKHLHAVCVAKILADLVGCKDSVWCGYVTWIYAG